MLRRLTSLSISLSLCGTAGLAVPAIQFDGATRIWRLSNAGLTAEFQFTPQETFELKQLRTADGDTWMAPFGGSTSPIKLLIGSTQIGADTRFDLADHFVTDLARGGRRQTVALDTLDGAYRVFVELELYGDHPVLRHTVRVMNRGPKAVSIRQADMMPYSFMQGQPIQLMRVNQWAVVPRSANFEPSIIRLADTGAAAPVSSGSGALQCAWTAMSDGGRGLFAGWEFNGRAQAAMRYFADSATLRMAIPVTELNRSIESGFTFDVPSAFIGFYRGDWDEAGYRTQRFVEDALAKAGPVAAGRSFPYIAWDSWGYEENLDEAKLRLEAELAAKAGAELFILDLGWAKRMGDWEADPAKFPGGLKELSAYVHSLGMKFGLHFAVTEASPDSEVMNANPDWASSENYNFHGAISLCPGHKPVRDWLVREAVRLIDEYDVDWLLQDGQTMVKVCTKTSHTHGARDSNYSNSVDGLDFVVEEVQRLRPRTMWENCENGGNMTTFKMAANYVTSITNDASGALGSRQAVYGATYPLPPRYTDRYMIEQEPTPYVTRSYMFGGPWILMNRLVDMPAGELEFLTGEIAIYKSIRGLIRDGKVFHLASRPADGRVDALQSYNSAADTAVAIVSREGPSAGATYTLRPRGLKPEGAYRIRFASDSRVLAMTGAQLIRQGVVVRFDQPFDSEIVFVEPQN